VSTLAWIVLANVVSTAISIALAALLSFRFLSKMVDQLVCISAGLLLAVAVAHLLPEAFESGVEAHDLGLTLLAGLIGFFLLEKLALIHHTHHHEGDQHHHHHGHDAQEARRGGLPILIGDAFHNFADGIGIAATIAVVAHEIPHEVGDFMILLNAGYTRRRALLFNLLSGSAAVAGGLVGYYLLGAMTTLLPFALAIAAASFIYIALSDLLPEMMRRSSLRQSAPQVALVLLGVALGVALTAGHGH
jgi:zinc and cadmium transporter